jgi:hypothetical protein
MPLSPTPPKHHAVLPFAACTSEDWLPAVKAMPSAGFRNFGKLLQGMKLIHADSGDARSLSPPHERVLARTLELQASDGLIPWAAWHHLQAGGAPAGRSWAFITPCHWTMGREHATLTDPAALGLQADESRTLLAVMQPYFQTSGITLHYLEPTRWLAEGEIFRGLPSASPDRVLGRNVYPWLPGAGIVETRKFSAGPPQGKFFPPRRERGSESPKAHEVASVGASAMRLLQSEMQMLLYTHPANDQRASRGQLSVNSFWVSGSGALPENFVAPPAAPLITMPRSLAQAAFSDDWPAYAQAWAALDASEGTRLLALQQRGEPIRLSLCGECNALTFESDAPGIFSRIRNLFSQNPLVAVLEKL